MSALHYCLTTDVSPVFVRGDGNAGERNDNVFSACFLSLSNVGCNSIGTFARETRDLSQTQTPNSLPETNDDL